MLSAQVIAVFVVACFGQIWTMDYKISLKTGTKKYAETDAEVFINIVGDNGETGTIY